MAVGDSVGEAAAKDLVVERVFDAPRERVFEVFTTSEHIQKWWGPEDGRQCRRRVRPAPGREALHQ